MSSGLMDFHRQQDVYNAGYCIVNKKMESTESMLCYLHDEEKNYYASLKHDKRKTSYLLGRFAAKKAILKLADIDPTGIKIRQGIFGYPMLEGLSNSRNIHVTITHCDHIAIAVAFPEEHPLGIDLENINRTTAFSLNEILNPDELEKSNNAGLDQEEAFAFFWTIKEALSKIFKTGFACNTEIFNLKEFNKIYPYFESNFANFIQYKAYSYRGSELICSIVFPAKSVCDFAAFHTSFKETLAMTRECD